MCHNQAQETRIQPEEEILDRKFERRHSAGVALLSNKHHLVLRLTAGDFLCNKMHVLQHNREHLHLDELISEGSLAPGQDRLV